MATRETGAFFSLGVQYYIAARFSALAYFSPVSGNLFHHAIETFLKGHLGSKKTLEDLKKVGHRLRSLWQEFKKEANDPGLDRFDQTISDLDAFESIRYPDQVLAYGMRSFISIKHRHVTGPHSQQTIVASGQQWNYQPPATEERPEPVYQVVVREIDELVRVIFEKASINPAFYLGGLPASARAILNEDNEFPMV